jgi:antitoxin component of MazEF toxin-antitoxin module
MTIPNHIVRAWKLEHGTRLVVQSTDQGILLFPRFFASLIQRRDDAGPPRG